MANETEGVHTDSINKENKPEGVSTHPKGGSILGKVAEFTETVGRKAAKIFGLDVKVDKKFDLGTEIDGAMGVSGQGGKEIIPQQYKYFRILGSGEYYAVKRKNAQGRSIVDKENNVIKEGPYKHIEFKNLTSFGKVFIAEDPTTGEVLVINPSGETLIKDKNVIKKELESYRSYRIYAFDGLLAYETREGGKEVMNLKQEGTENPIKLYNVEYSCYIYPSNKNPFKEIRDEYINGIGEKRELSRIVIKSFTLNGKKYKNKKGFTRDKIMEINQQKNS